MALEIYVDLPDHSRFWLAEGLDGRREAVSGPSMPWSKGLQVVHGVEADSVDVFDRGGSQQTVAFTVTRLFDTQSQARRYIYEHASRHHQLPGKMTFVERDEDGVDIWELVGHLSSAEPRRIGVTVLTSYQMVGARWQRPATY